MPPQKGVVPPHLLKKKRYGKSRLAAKRKTGNKNMKQVAAAREKAEKAELPAAKKVKLAARPSPRPRPKYELADNKDVVSGTLMRALISAYFVTQMDAPPGNEWRGRVGTISYIIKNLKGLTKGHYKTVERVLQDTVWCHKHGFHCQV